jgi:hypothetical protein
MLIFLVRNSGDIAGRRYAHNTLKLFVKMEGVVITAAFRYLRHPVCAAFQHGFCVMNPDIRDILIYLYSGNPLKKETEIGGIQPGYGGQLFYRNLFCVILGDIQYSIFYPIIQIRWKSFANRYF